MAPASSVVFIFVVYQEVLLLLVSNKRVLLFF